MLKTQEKVREFLLASGRIDEEFYPRVEGVKFKLLRDLILEESSELDIAMSGLSAMVENGDSGEILTYWANTIDAICDLLYVIHNASNALGIDIEPFFDAIHEANMRKIGGPVRADGKIMKPEGWKHPDVEQMLINLLNSF